MIVNRRRIMWGEGDFMKDYLFFTALDDGTFKFNKDGLYYSTDGTAWTVLAANTNTPLINAGDKIYFKGTPTPSTSSPQGIGTFSSTGRFEAGGNIMSLLFGDEFEDKTSLEGKSYAFTRLFSNCTGMVDAKKMVLPATTLADYCYYYTFEKTSIKSAPVLPATTLRDFCYRRMFSGCQHLIAAPDLLSTTLVRGCYQNMLYQCSVLNYIKCLATDISASSCLGNWVNGVAANGTFVKNAVMSGWTTGVNGIPDNWTVEDYE